MVEDGYASTDGMVDSDMPERLELANTMNVVRAMEDEAMRDSLMDVISGGEMARGNSAAAMELLERKKKR